MGINNFNKMYKFALVATASALSLNGNATGNATASTLPYGQTDYGVAGGVTYHSETMGLANERWARQNAGVQGQQASDVWRNTGPKAAWGEAPNPQPPKIAFSQRETEPWSQRRDGHLPYGQTDYGVKAGSAQHEDTMDWANQKWAEQKANVNGQAEDDKWRAVKDDREIPKYKDLTN